MKWFAWILVPVLARRPAAAGTETRVLKKVGDAVTLQPGAAAVSQPISSLLWLHDLDMAVEFDGKETEYFRHFKARGDLDTRSGALTITGLTFDDSGLYAAEVNGLRAATATRLQVLAPVPVPSVHVSCDEQKTVCTLECAGLVPAEAEPVYYRWKFGEVETHNSSKKITSKKEDGAAWGQVSCAVGNPVSLEHSASVPEPFTSSGGAGANRSTGVVVFFVLLGALLLLGVAHRCLSGKWFFQKGSMPWTAAFWKKEGSAGPQVI